MSVDSTHLAEPTGVGKRRSVAKLAFYPKQVKIGIPSSFRYTRDLRQELQPALKTGTDVTKFIEGAAEDAIGRMWTGDIWTPMSSFPWECNA